VTKRQIAKLRKLSILVQDLLKQAEAAGPSSSTHARSNGATRNRRTSHAAEKMRADVLAKRAKGVPATRLAEKYNVSTAYIYMIK
jgi:hypothetical protein